MCVLFSLLFFGDLQIVCICPLSFFVSLQNLCLCLLSFFGDLLNVCLCLLAYLVVCKICAYVPFQFLNCLQQCVFFLLHRTWILFDLISNLLLARRENCGNLSLFISSWWSAKMCVSVSFASVDFAWLGFCLQDLYILVMALF
jgi:hypothetical protein